MIHLVLRNPNGDGTFSDALGMTTDNAPHTVNGVVCLPGIIGDDSVSQMESAIDISQARGNVSQGVSWSFDILDWTGSARRSVGILDGGTRFVGWRVAMYLSDTGVETTLAPVCGSADAFQVSDVESSGTRITLSVVSAWTLQAGTLGLAYGEQVVGLVAGDHAVSVPTQALPDSEAISFKAYPDHQAGYPGAPELIGYDRSYPHADAYVDGVTGYHFECATHSDAVDFSEKITIGTTLIRGRNTSSIVQSIEIYNDIAVRVKSEDGSRIHLENIEDVSLCNPYAPIPVCYGAAKLVGFGDLDNLVSPNAEITNSESFNILELRPRCINSGKTFPGYSVLNPLIVWENGTVELGVDYRGGTQYISNSPNDIPDFSELNNFYIPVSPIKFSATKKNWVESSVRLDCQLRVQISEEVSSLYSGFIVDRRVRIDSSNGVKSYSAPFYAGGTTRAVSYQLIEDLFGPAHIDASIERQRFTSIAEVNACLGMLNEFNRVYDGEQYACFQITNIILYGIKQLSLGSDYAFVQPGASPWWSTPLQPAATAAALLNAVAPASTPNIPKDLYGYPFGLSGWGQYFEPEKTHTEAAVALCEEFWSILCPDGVDGQSGAGLGEVIETPPSALGAVEDVVTEPTIEYAPVGGNYTGKAYIAHVDEEFDISNAARFYGGWGEGADDSEFPGGDYGYMIWRTCREAYKVHGNRRAATYQFDGVHFAGNVGGYWFEAMRNGARRIEWLAYQPRFVTFKIRESSAPTWWAGNAVTIPTTMAGFAGYDLSAFSTDPVISVSKTFDPMTMETEYEVALPPVISTGTTDRIIQTANVSNDRIVQSLTATDRIIQVIEA